MLGGSSLRGKLLHRRARYFVKQSAAKLLALPGGIFLLGMITPQIQRPRGLVVLLHGWEGCADSNYMLSLGARLHAAGFAVFRLNFRDHGGTQRLNEELFHSCRIGEVVDAVAVLQREMTTLPLYLVGFSLGGNFALRVAARAAASNLRIERVVAVCPVVHPHSTMSALESGLWVYRYYFLNRWRRSLYAKSRAFPQLYDFGDLSRFSTLTETTDFFVRTYTEFADLDEYLSGYSIVGDALLRLAARSHLLATMDDPVIPARDLDFIATTDALSIHRLAIGGHCGLLNSYSLNSWIDDAVLGLLTRQA
jgi:predicted alpha/beta-fold hydrolase